MPACEIKQIVQAHPLSEGAGVTVHRTIGTPQLRHLDPFLMLDHFGSDNPDEYIAGFPDHPHRGFITFTYMLDGHMLHEDSMGNRGDLKAGGAQWMKAASGVIHSEMPQQIDGLMRGFQLWINLPAAEKMSAPGYQEFSDEAFPRVEIPGGELKLVCGEYAGVSGPIQDATTEMFYFDLHIEPNETLALEVPVSHQCFTYCYGGQAVTGDDKRAANIPTHSLTVFTRGDRVSLRAGADGAKLILVGGKPINEEVVQYGPFVMNSRAEIERAIRDFQAGKLVQEKAAFVSDLTT